MTDNLPWLYADNPDKEVPFSLQAVSTGSDIRPLSAAPAGKPAKALPDIFQKVADKVRNLDDTTRSAVLFDLFGIRGGKNILTFLNVTSPSY